MLTEQGHPEDGTDDEAPNQAETFVIMKPESEWHTGPQQGADRRRHARRAREAPGRRLQLQPAHQGPRRGVHLRHPRAGRRQDLRRGPEPDARQARGGEAHPRPRRAARATSRSTAPAPRSTSSPTSIATRSRATASRCATSRTSIESAFGGKLATDDLGGRAQGRRAREAARRRRRATTHGGAARDPRRQRRASRCRALANVHVDRGPHADQPRAGRPLPGPQVQHRGPRHGLVRRRGAGARAQARSSCPRATT